jgi:tRNA A58 N-methylase Trm61
MEEIAWYMVSLDEFAEPDSEDGLHYVPTPERVQGELNALKEDGAPDTESVEFISIDAEDRDEAIVFARGSAEFAAWIKANEIWVE